MITDTFPKGKAQKRAVLADRTETFSLADPLRCEKSKKPLTFPHGCDKIYYDFIKKEKITQKEVKV